MTDNGAHDEHENGASETAPIASPPDAVHPRTPKREPIFNRMPLGIAGLIAAILTAHLISLLAGERAAQAAVLKFGVMPAQIADNLSQGRFLDALLPLLSYQFMHGGPLHLVMNLVMLLQAGPIAEMGLARNRDGVARFIVFYLACGVFAALFYCWLNPGSPNATIGASGAISGVFGGFLWAAIGLARPGQAMLKPVLTSAAAFLLINVGLAWVGRELKLVPIAWESHLGGFLTGLILYPFIARIGRVRDV